MEIYTDSRNTIKWVSQPLTASRASKPGGEIWAAIQNLQKTHSAVEVILTHVQGHGPPVQTFKTDPGKFLIMQCDTKCRALRAHTEIQVSDTLLPERERGILRVQGVRTFDSINSLIAKIDSRKHEYQYIKSKYSPYHLLVDLEARAIASAVLSTSELKCIAGFNQHAVRDKILNRFKSDKCDVCGSCESWSNIVTFRANARNNTKFIKTLTEELQKIEIDRQIIDIYRQVENIKAFLFNNGIPTGTQTLIGYDKIFRGIIVRD